MGEFCSTYDCDPSKGCGPRWSRGNRRKAKFSLLLSPRAGALSAVDFSWTSDSELLSLGTLAFTPEELWGLGVGE